MNGEASGEIGEMGDGGGETRRGNEERGEERRLLHEAKLK